ncbi:MAG: hypothetical protein K0S09_1409 [Sphingobacteriaceae bacterium]|jgi:hypothetical protein|nr:hypothetical protein [Sphingobacteriaceae bacterium]
MFINSLSPSSYATSMHENRDSIAQLLALKSLVSPTRTAPPSLNPIVVAFFCLRRHLSEGTAKDTAEAPFVSLKKRLRTGVSYSMAGHTGACFSKQLNTQKGRLPRPDQLKTMSLSTHPEIVTPPPALCPPGLPASSGPPTGGSRRRREGGPVFLNFQQVPLFFTHHKQEPQCNILDKKNLQKRKYLSNFLFPNQLDLMPCTEKTIILQMLWI